MSDAYDRLIKQLKDVDNLIEHHSGDGARGRPSQDEGPLNRSCVVLTYAAWEVYVEDSLVWAAEKMVDASEFFLELPDTARAFTEDAVRQPGDLADGGWRKVLVQAVKTKLQGDPLDAQSFGMNTAGPKQIAAFHDQLLGVRLLDRCSWTRMKSEAIKRKLAKLVSDRGSIVHTGTLTGLSLGKAREYRNFIGRLGEALDAQLAQWLRDQGVVV